MDFQTEEPSHEDGFSCILGRTHEGKFQEGSVILPISTNLFLRICYNEGEPISGKGCKKMNGNREEPRKAEEVELLDDEPRTEGTEKKRKSVKERMRSLGIGAWYALCGYGIGFATLPFGASPFGIALLCAVDRRVLYTYAGLCVAAFLGDSRVLMIGTYTAILVIRLLARFLLDVPWSESKKEEMGEKPLREIAPFLFREKIGLRMASAALAAFGVGLYRLIVGGFLFYDLYGSILLTVTAPVAVLLFTGVWSQADRAGGRYLSGLLSIAFVLLWAVGDTQWYGVSLGTAFAMLLTLYLTKSRGLVAGVTAGTVCGLAVSVALAPSFAFGALVAGVLFPISTVFAALSALAVALAWGAYANGIQVLNGTLSALLTSCLLFPVLDKLFLRKRAQTETAEHATAQRSAEKIACCHPMPILERDGLRMGEYRRRLEALGDSLSALSGEFRRMSQQMQTPRAADLRQICDRAFDSSCVSCSEKEKCWGERYRETSDEVGQLCAVLHRNGRVERSDASDSLAVRCGRLPDILEEMNHNTALRRREMEEGDRTEIFAMDYYALSELLRGAVTERTDGETEERLSRELCDALNEAGLEAFYAEAGAARWYAGGRGRGC